MELFYRGWDFGKLNQHLIPFLNENAEASRLHLAMNKIAIPFHRDQKRRDGAYINHILRVTLRIANNFNIKDYAILCAALLHDTVEDQSEKYTKMSSPSADDRENAFLYIKENFGEEVCFLVQKLTNPQLEANLSQQKEWELYRKHVVEAIQSPNVFYIKLSDFLDNATQLELLDDTDKRTRLQQKYAPLYNVFIERLMQEDILIAVTVKTFIQHVLQEAQTIALSV